jgi:diguanylate cyclase (GGDEF)-like protein
MDFALPRPWRSPQLRRGESRALALGFVLLLAALAVVAANAIFGVGGRPVTEAIPKWVTCGVYVLVAAIVTLRAVRDRTRRGSWALFALGLSLYALGNVLWNFWIGNPSHPPIPSICDALWLSLYPLSYAGIVGFARANGEKQVPIRVWLDGVIAGSGLAALGAALVFPSLLASATGGTAATATEFAYPIGDLLLAALVMGVLALRGWRVNRTWTLLGGGFLLLAVADCLYAVQVAGGSSSTPPMTNLFYLVAVVLLACAAWQEEPHAPKPRLDRMSVLVVPAAFTVAALSLLVYGNTHRLDRSALGLAILTVLAMCFRMGLAFRDLRSLTEARHQAATDDLTSLPNRRLFIQRLRNGITAASMTNGEVSVLMLDLDNFKQLNDTLGHSAGDTLLRMVGPRLAGALRTTDTVARLGGDEFVVLLDQRPDEETIAQVADRILHALREPFEVQGLALRLTASLGIASFPAHAQDGDQLMKCADIAMYQAKAARSGYEFYARDRDTNSRERLGVAGELAAALDENRLEVHFQPKADMASGMIVGVEALVRLRLRNGGFIPPIEFLAAAEHAGMSRPLTRKVLALALAQLAIWRSEGHDIHVAVNTTVADLLDSDFPFEVAEALTDAGLPPESLILEVTESSILLDPVRIGDVLTHLRDLGIGLSLDDFGTGYSSLAHLKLLPVDEVKIDRSFVSRMCTDSTDAAIVYATVELAHKLGIRVVAEGAEDEATWQALETLGCETVQGYVLSRPVPPEDLTQLLNTKRRPPSASPKTPIS